MESLRRINEFVERVLLIRCPLERRFAGRGHQETLWWQRLVPDEFDTRSASTSSAIRSSLIGVEATTRRRPLGDEVTSLLWLVVTIDTTKCST